MLGDNVDEAAFAQLYDRARSARARARTVRNDFRVARDRFSELRAQFTMARQRGQIVRQMWLSPDREGRVEYTAQARMVARLASMPVIEQAKGIIMAQCGWTAEQAFEAMKQVSQRTNVKLRVLATQVVAATAEGAARQAHPAPPARHRSLSVLPLPEPEGPADPAALEEQAE